MNKYGILLGLFIAGSTVAHAAKKAKNKPTVTKCDSKDTACRQCSTCALTSVCKTEFEACVNHSQCIPYMNCVVKCAEKTGDFDVCIAMCTAEFKEGRVPADKVHQCLLCDGCHKSCGGADTCQRPRK